MSTILQERLAKGIIENQKRNPPLNKTELLSNVGYGKITAEAQQTRTIEQKGVLKALEKYGFSVDNAKKVVSEIMLSKRSRDENKLKATDQVFKVTGAYAPEKTINVNMDGSLKELSNEELEQIAYNQAETKENEALQAP